MSLACVVSHADGAKRSLIRPKETAAALELASTVNKTGDLYAKFNGQVWIDGTFVVRWPAGASAKAYKNPDYVLIPDRTAASNLPYFVISDPTFRNSYKIRNIELLNGEEALHIAFTDAQAAKILGRKVDAVRVSGKFLIEGYVVGVECDAPWAKANLVNAELPEQVGLAHRKVPEGC